MIGFYILYVIGKIIVKDWFADELMPYVHRRSVAPVALPRMNLLFEPSS